MNFPDDIPTCRMSPPQFASSNNDIIEVSPQIPMQNDHFEPHSFKRARIADNNPPPSGLMCPPSRMIQPPPNRGTSSIFFKTRICTKFRFGTCRNGENCNYAHGADEIRQPPRNWQELVDPRNEERHQVETRQQPPNWDEDQKIIHKMKLCKKYYNGEECPYGDKCSFLHEDPARFRDDSWKTRECSAISVGNIGSPKSFGYGSNNLEGIRAVNKPARSAYWKTKLCQWQHTGSCPFGETCDFAHGEAELQAPGMGIEAEAAVAIVNSTKSIIPTSPKASTGIANDSTTTYTASLLMTKDEEQDKKKHLLRLKLGKKINGIYGDWIDD